MPDETELRALLNGETPEPGHLDVQHIVSRARARRLPRQLAAGLAGGALVIGAVAVVVPALGSLGSIGFSAASGSQADEAPVEGGGMQAESSGGDEDLSFAPPLEVTLGFDEIRSDGTGVSGVATIRNASDQRVQLTGDVALTIVGDGGWFEAATTSVAEETLDPGDSLRVPVSFASGEGPRDSSGSVTVMLTVEVMTETEMVVRLSSSEHVVNLDGSVP